MLEGLKNWATNTGKAFKLVAAEAMTFPEKYKTLSPAGKAGAWIWGGAVAATCVAGFFIPVLPGAMVTTGIGLLAAQGIGLAAYGTMLVAQNMKNKQDIMNVLPIATGALGLQKLLIGGVGYAIMAGVASLRATAMNAIGADRPIARTAAAWGLWAGGAALLVPATILQPMNALPLASMTLATVADLTPASDTRYARLMRGIAFVNNTLYSAFFTHSLPNTLLDATVGATIANSIKKYDVPASPEGAKVPLWNRIQLYAQNMLTHKPMPTVYPAQTVEYVPQKTKKSYEDSVILWEDIISRNFGASAPAKDTGKIHFTFDRNAEPAAPPPASAFNDVKLIPHRKIYIQLDLAA